MSFSMQFYSCMAIRFSLLRDPFQRDIFWCHFEFAETEQCFMNNDIVNFYPIANMISLNQGLNRNCRKKSGFLKRKSRTAYSVLKSSTIVLKTDEKRNGLNEKTTSSKTIFKRNHFTQYLTRRIFTRRLNVEVPLSSRSDTSLECYSLAFSQGLEARMIF